MSQLKRLELERNVVQRIEQDLIQNQKAFTLYQL